MSFRDLARREVSRVEFRYDYAGRLVQEAQTNSEEVLPPEMRAALNPAQLQTIRDFSVPRRQYASVYPLKPSTVTAHAAEGWLALDVDSHDIPPSEATGVPRNYQAIGSEDRETSYFLNMYLRDARAIDYIFR